LSNRNVKNLKRSSQVVLNATSRELKPLTTHSLKRRDRRSAWKRKGIEASRRGNYEKVRKS